MFKKYQIVYFTQSGVEKPRTISMSVLPVVMVLLAALAMLTGTVLAQLYIHKRPLLNITAVEINGTSASDERSVRYTDIVMNTAIEALQNNDKFGEDIFIAPMRVWLF